jgi:hopanoid-associated phosphorylase
MTVGVVAALPVETKALCGNRGSVGSVIELGPILLICSGIGPERAARSAYTLVECGVAGLISWGTAGGLAPGLNPGDLLLPTIVRAVAGQEWRCDETWRIQIASRIGFDLPAQSGMQLSTDEAVSSPADKQRMHAGNAMAVDMESAAIGEVANSSEIPFIVIRAICDPAHCAVPPTALAAIDAEGRFRPWSFARSLLTHPGDLAGLIRLRWGLRAAQATLAEVVQRVGGHRGLGLR